MRKLQQGFTIIEVIIVIAIGFILMAGLLQLYVWHQNVFVLEEATVRTTGDVRNTLLNMREYIAQASSIESSRAFSGTTYTSNGNTVVVRVPSINASGDIITNTYDYAVFYLTGDEIFMITEPGSGSVRPASNKRLADNVQSFSLTYNNGTPSAASNVTIGLQTHISTARNEVGTTISDTVFLRNQ